MKNKCAIIVALSMFLSLFAIPGSLFASTASNKEIAYPDSDILKNFPYINQVDDLPAETMKLINTGYDTVVDFNGYTRTCSFTFVPGYRIQ